MKGYYGQHFEDYYLWQVFENQETGFFVDVGAFDGIHLSNSYLFELAGWTGICIEPHPKYFAKCQENRPGSVCIHGACVGDATQETVTFYAGQLGLLSSIDPDYEDVARRYRNRGLEFEGFEAVEVPAVTLDSVLSGYESVDFITIDVEGRELQVLEGLDLEKYHPRVIVVEAMGEKARNAIDWHLRPHGYHRLLRAGPNHFYCANRDDARHLHKRPRGHLVQLAAYHPELAR